MIHSMRGRPKYLPGWHSGGLCSRYLTCLHMNRYIVPPDHLERLICSIHMGGGKGKIEIGSDRRISTKIRSQVAYLPCSWFSLNTLVYLF